MKTEILALIESAEKAITAYTTERARLIAERKAAPEAEQTAARTARYAREIVALGRAPMVAKNRLLAADLEGLSDDLLDRVEIIERFRA